LVIPRVEGVLEDLTILLDLALAHIENFPAKGVDYMLSRMRAHLNQSELLALFPRVLLLDQPSAILFGLPENSKCKT
jgi:hypothetical protein